MVEIKNYIWIIPLIGGIIILIALVTPAAYNYDYSGFYYIWSWGLFAYEDRRPFVDYFGKNNKFIGFNDNFVILITSICSSLFVLFCALIIIKSAIKYKKDTQEERKTLEKCLVPSTILISFSVVMVSLIEILFINCYERSFWGSYFPGFGTIGMFIGAVLTIIGYYISKKL